jgi:hypothetical protein
MKLIDYFNSARAKPTPWAKDNGIAPSVISRYLNGKGISAKNALRIQAATGGKVTVMELLFGSEGSDRNAA